MLVLVTGGRDYHPTRADAWALRVVLRLVGATTLMHGNARGVDQWCGRVAERLGLDVLARPADWSRGKRGGPERNAAMVDEALQRCPDAVLVSFPGGRGTAHCTGYAKTRGMRVFFVGEVAG